MLLCTYLYNNRKHRRIIATSLLITSLTLTHPISGQALNNTWEAVSMGVGEVQIRAIVTDPSISHYILAASEKNLYESSDGGKNWIPRFGTSSESKITSVSINLLSRKTVLVSTTNGLYGSFDGGIRWRRLITNVGSEIECTQVKFHPYKPSSAFVGTTNGLWVSNDDGMHWKKITVPSKASNIQELAFDPIHPNRIYIMTSQILFTGDLSTGKWRQQFATMHTEEMDVGEAPHRSETVEEARSPLLSAVATHPSQPDSVYLATTRGVEVSHDRGKSWQHLTRSGLISTNISAMLLEANSPLTIYAATLKGVATYKASEPGWNIITTGLVDTDVKSLASTPTHLWAATDQGLFRLATDIDFPSEEPFPNSRELLSNFHHEPSITEVREAAIRYAEVHPNKIKLWRWQASLQALLPTISFGIDKDEDMHITSRGSTSNPDTDRFHTMKDPSKGLDVSIAWDLGELIWNDDQTSIDVRSKLMVQLRDDIVDEVTRTYFERRRLQISTMIDPPTDNKMLVDAELRVQELTALIDGLTGGYFTKSISLPDNI